MYKEVFLGYSNTSKAYRVFNTRALVVDESTHVKFNDGLTFDRKQSDLGDDFLDMQVGPSIAPREDKVK